MAEAVDYKQIGTRPVRPDGLDKVTGRAQFGADTVLPNMIHGKVLRSPHAHAKIVSIDVTEALAIPGVFAAISRQRCVSHELAHHPALMVSALIVSKINFSLSFVLAYKLRGCVDLISVPQFF